MVRVDAGEFFAKGMVVFISAWGLLYACKERDFMLLTIYQFIFLLTLFFGGCDPFDGVGICRGIGGGMVPAFRDWAAVMQFIIVCIFVFQIWQIWKCASANPVEATVVVMWVAVLGVICGGVNYAEMSFGVLVLVEVLVLVSGLAAVELVAWFVREGQTLWNDHRCHRSHHIAEYALDKVVVVCGCGGAVWMAVEA